MKNVLIMPVIISLFSLSFVIESFANEVIWDEIGRGRINLTTVLVHPDNQKIIYIGLKGGIFKTENNADTWRPLLSIRGQNNYVNFLMFNPKNKDNLFAGTGSGLYYSNNQGRTWSRLFRGKTYLENDCSALAVLTSRIFLGTKEGLFLSKDSGRSWHRVTGELGISQIMSISYNLKEEDYIYVASSVGVFKTIDAGESWKEISLTNAIKDDKEVEKEESNEGIEEEKNMQIRYLQLDSDNLNLIYLATSKGVYKSQDRGESWQLISSYGLLSKDVRFLLKPKGLLLYAVTKSGIFEYRNERWYELSSRLISEEIKFLDLDKEGNLYAACDSGLFKANIGNFTGSTQDNITEIYYKNEPKISDIQKAAIKYAEVEPEKIARWRKQAARKAFLPKVSAGVNRDTSDLWHWESGSTTKTGDDVLTRGRDTIGWDVSLTWDLGEVIWNDAQTSIDVRSRLMVQLRDDVLDEVTKLYFERIRIKMELDNLGIEDRKRRFEKELKLQELTAQLDGLTGGYFSGQIKEKF